MRGFPARPSVSGTVAGVLSCRRGAIKNWIRAGNGGEGSVCAGNTPAVSLRITSFLRIER